MSDTTNSSNKDKLRREQALEYHAAGRPGKIEVVPTKEAKTQKDLSLAYSPGVAIPCTEIKNNPADVYKYTAKGNLVGVITNGTYNLIHAMAAAPAPLTTNFALSIFFFCISHE